MKKQFSSKSDINETSHVRLSARGMRKNYRLHVDSGFNSFANSSAGKTKAYGTGWVLADEGSRYLWDGAGVSAQWVENMEHSTVVELMGILSALETIRDNHYGILHPTNHISIFCDNDSVQFFMDNRIHRGVTGTFAHYFVEKIMEFQNLVHLSFKWEKGHSDNIMNNIADRFSFYARKELEKFDEIGPFSMDLILLDALRRKGFSDNSFSQHLLHIGRRQSMCAKHSSVDLSYNVVDTVEGNREVEWFALHGNDFDMGSFELPKKRGSMEALKIAASVLKDFMERESYSPNADITFVLPIKRSMLDSIFMLHKNGKTQNETSKVVKAASLLSVFMESMNLRFIQESPEFQGIASTMWEQDRVFA